MSRADWFLLCIVFLPVFVFISYHTAKIRIAKRKEDYGAALLRQRMLEILRDFDQARTAGDIEAQRNAREQFVHVQSCLGKKFGRSGL